MADLEKLALCDVKAFVDSGVSGGGLVGGELDIDRFLRIFFQPDVEETLQKLLLLWVDREIMVTSQMTMAVGSDKLPKLDGNLPQDFQEKVPQVLFDLFFYLLGDKNTQPCAHLLSIHDGNMVEFTGRFNISGRMKTDFNITGYQVSSGLTL